MWDCFKSTGPEIREDRQITSFSEIRLENKIDLVITQDTIERLAVVCGENLINKIETTVSSGLLTIQNHNTFNFVRSYDRHITVYVSVKHLKALDFRSAGNVSTSNMLSDSALTIESFDGSGLIDLSLQEKVIHTNLHTGPATIRLKGSSPLLYIYSGGNGEVDTKNIPCPQIYLTNRGTGNFYISTDSSPTSNIQAELTSTGDVYCSGRPSALAKSETGSGKFILE